MNRMLTVAGITCLSLLSGCATSTKSTVNTVESNQPIVSKTLLQPQEKSLKRKVAIARFTDETKNGKSIFVNSNYDQIGKQASDILSARLTESGKFLMFEREDLDKILREQSYGGIEGTNVGADFLIIGSISEFGRKSTSDTGVFSRNKIQIANATVNVRLIDTKTGAIIFSQEASGEARAEASTVLGIGERASFDTSLNDKAISAAISKLTSNLMENLLDTPWRAYLIGEQDGFYIMTGGRSQGIAAGDEFAVVKKGKVIKNPQTGMNIELPGEQLTTLEIVQTLGSGNDEVSLVKLNESLNDIALENVIVKEMNL